ncbi:HD domain-containing phosphohydrolase, partial [Sulfurimonas sp.]|uniref:HD domain-containing phosphohydrolase n=1 Tax=Sulfurimonas sp. TaxID=2022749 RepID=UPI0035688923
CSELRDKKHIDSGDCERLKAALGRKEIFRMQFENIAKNGSSYFVDATVIPIVDGKGIVVEHLHLMCNVTELVELHIEIEKTQQEVICRMGEISESRSKETGKHIHRVSEYSRLLALKAGFSEEEANIVASASPMHDIGKVAIPDKVLLKPGKLDDEEWEIMRSHSMIGYTVLSGSQRPLLNAAAVIAKEHHEKYDGSGYPDGIIGEDIHIYARIVAIADVFDALGTDRIYKKGWGLDRILKLFEEEKGKHFDSNLTTLFLENIEEFLKIRDEYKDITE